MRIGHFSDIHGDFRVLKSHETPDLWVCTGDFFPNSTRGDVSVEVPFQTAWFHAHAREIVTLLRGIPLIWVAGNHDYVSLPALLRSHDYTGQVWDIEDGPVDFGGERFAGFREIPFIIGEWAGEVHDMAQPVDRALSQDPTILVTHCPPLGILDGRAFGSSPLTTALTWRHHRIHTHLFGHIHIDGIKQISGMDVLFVNSACGVQFLNL